MTKLTLREPVADRLRKAKGKVQICDSRGHTIGYFMPEQRKTKARKIPISDEELRQAERDPETFTTAEVLAYLETL